MILYRYQLKNGLGILTALDEYFGLDEALDLSWIFEDKLALPDIDMRNTISYFTEAGNRKFHKAITKILNRFEQSGIKTEKIQVELSDLHNVIYTDNLQVVCKRGGLFS